MRLTLKLYATLTDYLPPAARPQTGLQQADIVWEQVVEGGISRYVAVYHSTLPTTM